MYTITPGLTTIQFFFFLAGGGKEGGVILRTFFLSFGTEQFSWPFRNRRECQECRSSANKRTPSDKGSLLLPSPNSLRLSPNHFRGGNLLKLLFAFLPFFARRSEKKYEAGKFQFHWISPKQLASSAFMIVTLPTRYALRVSHIKRWGGGRRRRKRRGREVSFVRDMLPFPISFFYHHWT